MEGYWVSYMVLPPAAGALPSAGLDGAAAADVGATVLVLPPAAGALPSAGLDGAAAADVGATVLVAVAPAHPAAASSPHVPIASATRCLVMFMFPPQAHYACVFSLVRRCRTTGHAGRRGSRAPLGRGRANYHSEGIRDARTRRRLPAP